MRYHRSVMRAANQPVSWWGWHWEPPVPLSIVQILGAGNMPPRLAAMFWLALERGASLIVAADPPSAGKTATLTALLSLTPPETPGDISARRAFELLAEGYSLATTVHANTVDEVLAILRNDIGVPPQHIARLTFIAPLHLGRDAQGLRRRVQGVAFIQPGADRHVT